MLAVSALEITASRQRLVARPKKRGSFIPVLLGALVFLSLGALLGTGVSDLTRRPGPPLPVPPPRNVIFMIADGLGPTGATLARLVKAISNGEAPGSSTSPLDTSLRLDAIFQGVAQTYSANSQVTDSAAGATAYSCALKTYNYGAGVNRTGWPCATLLEAAKAAGMSTGIAVTSSVTDATPASFAAHVRQRFLENSIALQYATALPADVVLGGGRKFFEPQGLPQQMARAGYVYVTNASGLASVRAAPVLGLFAEKHNPYEIDRPSSVPSLKAMAMKAVKLLRARSERGFFLLVEGSKIDKSAHPNDGGTFVAEILAYDEAVGALLDWARADGDTLLVSTSDHETGGVSLGRGVVTEENGTDTVLRMESLRSDGFSPDVYTLHAEQ